MPKTGCQDMPSEGTLVPPLEGDTRPNLDDNPTVSANSRIRASVSSHEITWEAWFGKPQWKPKQDLYGMDHDLRFLVLFVFLCFFFSASWYPANPHDGNPSQAKAIIQSPRASEPCFCVTTQCPLNALVHSVPIGRSPPTANCEASFAFGVECALTKGNDRFTS